ncbi:unnamed protein product [Rotaria sp. Silwood2]|nr:unnamed protein product [Rotaria sp. Silwood2]
MPHCLILGILSTQRLISNETNLNDIEIIPNTIYVKNSMSMYFDRMQNHVKLICQFSTTDIRDLLRFIIFISELIS